MYICKKFTADDLKRRNSVKPCILMGQRYVVTRYSVDVTRDIPVVFKAEDIEAFDSPADAEAYCISTYAHELDIEHGVQYFYRVRCVGVCTLNTEVDGLVNMDNKE